MDDKDLKTSKAVIIQSLYRSYSIRKLYNISNEYYEQICIDIMNEIKNDIPLYDSYRYNNYANRIDKVGDVLLFDTVNDIKQKDSNDVIIVNDNNGDDSNKENIVNDDNILLVNNDNDNDDNIITKDTDIIVNDNDNNDDNIIVDNNDINDNDDVIIGDNNYDDGAIIDDNNDNIDTLHNDNTTNIINDKDTYDSEIPNDIKLTLLKAQEKFLKQSLLDRLNFLRNQNR